MKPKVFCIIMGGGRGRRLRPLTKLRAKPAVPLAGKYRLVDIPISNCLHSGLNHISILTQFNSASLHQHIQDTYRFDSFSGGYVDILAAEQTIEGTSWYQGTADAVRHNLRHFSAHDGDLFLILSGDQLYRMDYQELLRQHHRTGARVTIAAKPLNCNRVDQFGVLRVADDLSVTAFVEKPTDPEVVRQMQSWLPPRPNGTATPTGVCWVNMGIYVFEKRTLWDALTQNSLSDFSKEIIPSLVGTVPIYAFPFEGYWRDIGTVRAFFEANLELTSPSPPFNFFEPGRVIYTHPRFLPASRLQRCTIDQAIVADGCIIIDAVLERSVIGVRSMIHEGSRLKNVVMMGQDQYESPEAETSAKARGLPPIGIGKSCFIENAILDKNARIGDDVSLSPAGLPDDFEQGDVAVRDGVLIVTKNGVVPSGSRIGNA
ncbi:MAG TPA: sugar phosphate nucleotidyltransferase [Polyangiaceae bacterium]|mgnify:CR=1 FL=1|nr:MAG: Glucose-1-phosphate adenylyltransferase [Deltaproteobacteria bacterium ADurb.Bin207]HNT00167.1 sugar phosphate nucleotidyltransferase [Polyangiaceae bacterium]HNZ25023.1 sugar phosphate nucleotidyltransferase [Polyangiaceae bacterium]HOD23936.1 sugar phosphate nucleotidyltransferase [Polyangiaceae bacterium]HOE51159.1 sugar phosphate nucleotidyltransferase [Polyangiaceae bacterium]